MSNETKDTITNGVLETPPFDIQPPEPVPFVRKAEATGPKQPVILEETERLRAENIAIRAENLGYRKQNIQSVIVELNKEEMALKEENAKLRTELSIKYGMDSSRMKIRQDGTLTEEGIPTQGTLKTGSRP